MSHFKQIRAYPLWEPQEGTIGREGTGAAAYASFDALPTWTRIQLANRVPLLLLLENLLPLEVLLELLVFLLDLRGLIRSIVVALADRAPQLAVCRKIRLAPR